MNNWISVRAKIKKETYIELAAYCKASGLTPSSYIRSLIEKDKPAKVAINKAGVNEFKFNQSNDSFSWGVRYDDSSYKEIAEDLSMEFLMNLKKGIENAISLRNDYIHKRLNDSVAIPVNINKLKGSGKNVKS